MDGWMEALADLIQPSLHLLDFLKISCLYNVQTTM